MFCPKCGTKNEEESKFCTSCGEKLNYSENEKISKPNPNYQANQGGVRKNLKNKARIKINGSFIGATAIYIIVCLAIGAAFGKPANINEMDFKTLEFIGNIITIIIGTVFGYGLLSACFKTLRGKEVTFSEIFIEPFNHMKEMGYILLLIFICFLAGVVSGFLMVIPLIGLVVFAALIVALAYYAPVLTTFEMILIDQENKSELSFPDTFKRALDITKGHRAEYYGTLFSFAGWALLIIPTFGIILIWLLPYIQLTMTNLYRKWIGEETFETNLTGLSNGTVIGISLGGFGCLFVIGITILFLALGALIGVSGTFDFDDIINRIEESRNQGNYDIHINEYLNDMNINLK